MSEGLTYIRDSMLIAQLVNEYPEVTDVLYEHGMFCVGCPAARTESIAEACRVHGINPVPLMDALNRKIGELKAAENISLKERIAAYYEKKKASDQEHD